MAWRLIATHVAPFRSYGERMDRPEKRRKKEAREVHKRAEYARKAIGEAWPEVSWL